MSLCFVKQFIFSWIAETLIIQYVRPQFGILGRSFWKEPDWPEVEFYFPPRQTFAATSSWWPWRRARVWSFPTLTTFSGCQVETSDAACCSSSSGSAAAEGRRFVEPADGVRWLMSPNVCLKKRKLLVLMFLLYSHRFKCCWGTAEKWPTAFRVLHGLRCNHAGPPQHHTWPTAGHCKGKLWCVTTEVYCCHTRKKKRWGWLSIYMKVLRLHVIIFTLFT